jgi:amidase
MTELHFRSATALVSALRNREVSSRELLEHFLARVEKHNPALNAVVTLDVERARARAAEADAALARGESWGPLHGLPMTIKDSFETAGVRTTSGAPLLAQHVPANDATAVARLRAAGAVIFGKTNLPLLASDLQSYNAIFGTTNNPWDATRTPGGSSGGAAATLAAGLAGFELGSDIGGSIRTPCNWNGVFGHKPTYDLVPLRGHIPGPPGTLAEPDLAVAGPMGRSADDLELGLDVLAGPRDEERVAWRLELPPPRRGSLREYRVAAFLGDRDLPLDDEVARVLHEAVGRLRAAGAKIDEKARPFESLSEVYDPYLQLLMPVMSAGFPPAVFEELVRIGAQGPETPATRSARYSTARYRDVARANEARMQIRARFAAFFADYDVLLMPATAVPAIPHDHSEPLDQRTMNVNGQARPYFETLAWIAPATLTWHPASQAPVGRTRAGLPVGIQIVGPYLEDRTPIDFARHVEKVCGGFAAPPGF